LDIVFLLTQTTVSAWHLCIQGLPAIFFSCFKNFNRERNPVNLYHDSALVFLLCCDSMFWIYNCWQLAPATCSPW